MRRHQNMYDKRQPTYSLTLQHAQEWPEIKQNALPPTLKLVICFTAYPHKL